MPTTTAARPVATGAGHVPTATTGVWLALLSAGAFGTSGALAKSLIETGWSPGAAVTARIGLAALVLLIPALLSLRGRWRALRANAGLVVAFGMVAMAGAQLAYFNAVTTLSVGVALLLEYLGPVLLVAWLWAVHGHRPRPWTLAGIGLSMLGLAAVLDVTGGVRVDLVGVLWGLVAATCLAGYFLLAARDTPGLPPLAMAAGGMVVATTTLLLAGVIGVMPMTFATADVVLAGATMTWIVPVLGLSVWAGALAYATGVAATRRLGSKVASFVGLAEVLFAVVFAWLLLGELPMPIQLLGGVLIVAGVVAVRHDELMGARPGADAADHDTEPAEVSMTLVRIPETTQGP